MIRFSFKRNLIFFEGLIRWMLLRRLATGKLQFENEMGEIRVLSSSEVMSLWNKGDWVVDVDSLGSQADAIYIATPRDLSTFPEEMQKRVQRYMHYLIAVDPEKVRFNPYVWDRLIKSAAAKINATSPRLE